MNEETRYLVEAVEELMKDLEPHLRPPHRYAAKPCWARFRKAEQVRGAILALRILEENAQ